MEQKTLEAIQGAFKQAVDAFNAALVKSLGEKAAVAVPSMVAPLAAAAPKHRGRPAKAKSLPVVAASGAPKHRGRPSKKVDVLAKLTSVSAAPKRRGRPPKQK
jgi:hypothetical protein